MAYQYGEIVPYLLDWYGLNARILAWRANPKPYYVWVSEIMLQQTRVEAVKGYFDRFITALPDIKALAEADEEKLLKLWEGLGYYNRVRNLQKAAQTVMQDYQGVLPADYDKLLTLPGIGTYTAGAIASIAYHIPIPVVDGNVLRVAKRLAGSFDDITKDSVKKELWQDLMQIIPQDRPGDFNQAMMELGATVCLPNGKPHCEQCPVMHLCKAFHADTVMQIPVKPAKKERRREDWTILLMEYQDRYLIRKRASKGLLSGLWELPGLADKLKLKELELRLKEMGISPAKLTPMGEAKHIFSHVEWHMTGYHILLEEPEEEVLKENQLIWADRNEINHKYSIPNAFSAYTEQLKVNKMEDNTNYLL
ncbi:MAG TPA: A/G-specific adenine glycosylase [Mobilitalea sp.]|nr:A/G-specific adenine glycosylase [Mobilitalea sp.]